MSTTMHFGPEWMRTKHQPLSRSQPPPSPPPLSNPSSGLSSYSALVSPAVNVQQEKQDETHPFRYSKEELLRIYKEGPKGGLGLEVERWEGVVREIGGEPIGLRDMADAEKKLFAGPLNSDLRRRQSTDYLSPLNTSSLGAERPRLNHTSSSATSSPLRDRYPTLKRRDSNSESPTVNIPRKQSLSTLQAPTINSRNVGFPSPRARTGYNAGFDGVLNTGDTWTARRRTSEASLKVGGLVRESNVADGDNDEKASGIREEKDDKINPGGSRDTNSSRGQGGLNHEAQSYGLSPALLQSYGVNGVASTSDTAKLDSPAESGGTPGLLPGLQDLASVEWSYKDPSGNVQGPFRADLMQKWYNDGYFSPDLPMKRTQLDSLWTTVEELMKQAASDKIFLTPLLPSFPPGLSRCDGSPMQPVPSNAEANIFTHPYQPAPIRSLRTSTLESFAGSNPSDSPSSSFGAAHFGTGSPDPSTFGGRASNGNHYGADPGPSYGYPVPVDMSPFRRGQLLDLSHESPLRLNSPSYGNLTARPGMGVSVDNFGFGGAYNPVQGPWNASMHHGFSTYSPNPNSGSAAFGSSANYNPLQNGQIPNQSQVNPLAYGNPDIGSQAVHLDDKSPLNQINPTLSGLTADSQHFAHSAVPDYSSVRFHHPSPGSNNPLKQRENTENVSLSSPLLAQGPNSLPAGRSQAVWDASVEEGNTRRPGNFEGGHPTSLNTISATSVVPSQPSTWGPTGGQTLPPNSQSKDISPWVVASQGVVDSTWAESSTSDLTVSNVDQHNEQQDQVVEQSDLTDVARAEAGKSQTLQVETLASAETTPVLAVAQTKPRSKATVPSPQNTDLKPRPEASPSSTPSNQKAAWVKDTEKKKKPSPVMVSLREIQDAEAKAAEVRKAEKEKERASRITVTTDVKEDAPSFTTSWGLPTSQFVARTSGTQNQTPQASASSPPVWTTTTKPVVAKKTMKEIQEEEEKSKKISAKETVAVAAAKRAYAESTTKTNPSISSNNNAWVTVGPSGKTASATPSPVRPSAVSIASGSASHFSPSARPNSTSIVRSSTSTLVSKPAPAVPKLDDPSPSPSHEFLKWLSESLKGLNNSVNVEEIISMLLSFSLEPDPSTVEIISDTIYANSTTLDGRRFAAEFVSKRKADAVNRLKASSSTIGKASGKPVSIADVVKANPKASQPEWGFKVVNKKKKGGRS